MCFVPLLWDPVRAALLPACVRLSGHSLRTWPGAPSPQPDLPSLSSCCFSFLNKLAPSHCRPSHTLYLPLHLPGELLTWRTPSPNPEETFPCTPALHHCHPQSPSTSLKFPVSYIYLVIFGVTLVTITIPSLFVCVACWRDEIRRKIPYLLKLWVWAGDHPEPDFPNCGRNHSTSSPWPRGGDASNPPPTPDWASDEEPKR